MDGSSVFRQSGGAVWLTDAVFPRDGEVVIDTHNGVRNFGSASRGRMPHSSTRRYTYLDPAPPTEPQLKWHRWSESKPDATQPWAYIDADGFIMEGAGDINLDALDAVWWCYDPGSAKYGE